MAWWRKADLTPADAVAAAIEVEERREYLREIRQRNDQLARQEELAWQRKWPLVRPAPANPTFKIKEDDGLIKRAAKHVANDRIHDYAISLREWSYQREEKREAKAEAQARRDAQAQARRKAAQQPRQQQQHQSWTVDSAGTVTTERQQQQRQHAEAQLANIFGMPPQEQPAPAPRRGMRR